MSQLLLIVRVADRSGALERVLGLLRRRVLFVHRLSLAASDGLPELVLRVDEARTPRERLRAELQSLVDVVDVCELTAPTRELVVARLTPGARASDAWRLVSSDIDGAVVEFTGSPEDVDAALARLQSTGALMHVARSGELLLPGRDARSGADSPQNTQTVTENER